MNYLSESRVFLSFISAFIIIIFLLFGSTWLYRNPGSRVSFLSDDTSSFHRAAVLLDTIVQGMFSENISKKLPLNPVPVQNKKDKRRKYLTYILKSCLSREKHMILLVASFIGAFIHKLARPDDLRICMGWFFSLLGWFQKRCHAYMD